MQLRPYQSELKNDIYREWQTVQNVLAILATGAGKCLGKGTPVLMFDGTIKNVEDIKEGDSLMGPDSTPRRILSTCRGSEPLYRVIPVKGDPYVVNESHILSLKRTPTMSAPRYPSQSGDKIINISVKEYLGKSKTFKHRHKGWRAPVSWPRRNLHSLLTPYMLGLWLGDGHSRRPAITTADDEIVEYLYEYAKARKQTVRKESLPDNAANTYHICANWRRKGTLLSELKHYDLIKNKHIPHEYKTGSEKQRRELLAGLIDSDGSVDKSGYSFTLKSKTLTDDIVFVARSLGFAAYVSECEKTCTNTGATGTYYRFLISGETNCIPVILDHKKTPPRKQKKSVLVTGIKLEPLGVGDYYGFEIDGDHLFMLGDFTVTHNTVLFSDVISEHAGASCAVVHRQELVSQISIALARFGIKHRIIGPKNVIRGIVQLHMVELGQSYYDPAARCAVAGVDTLVRRKEELSHWLQQVTLWVMDEAHHVLEENKWGRAVEMFPNARGLGVTANTKRADGKGLGRHSDGLMDTLVEGPGMRDLINMGFLTDYRIFAPPSDLDLDGVKITGTGDFSKPQLKVRVEKSHIIGDVVEHYLKLARGKLGITFAIDVETATEIAAKFNASGVPAEVVSAKTPDKIRAEILRRFRRREILQLVNVDLFGEGFDLPAIECVSMARPTASFNLYCQQFGRSLRILDGKMVAIIIDHVGNVMRHGLPDAPQVWSLDRRSARGKNDAGTVPMKICHECTSPYEGFHKACPFCGYIAEPASRSKPEHVDGDLTELDAATLASMRGEVERIDAPAGEIHQKLSHAGASDLAIAGATKNHRARQQAQAELREAIAWWAGHQRSMGRADSESYRRFYFAFGVDVMTAQTLGRPEASALMENINKYIGELQSA